MKPTPKTKTLSGFLFRYLILVCFSIFSLSVYATHIVGGDLHYEYLGNDQYLITLKVYRDCATSSTNFDDPAAIGIYDSNGNLVVNLEIPLSEAIVSDVPVNLLQECLTPPDGLCVKEAIFSGTVTLPEIPGGYTIAYQRCCRNTTLVNTESNDDLGMTLFAEIPGSGNFWGNSNPSFNQYPPIVICLNQPFIFDHSATDIDGDELVYEFCNPLLTNVPGFYINPPGAPPYPELVFNPGFSYDYPITSDPAFAIDPVTGLLTGTPTQLGQYVVGICVKEYRNGQLVSTTNRDFQFNVTLCEMDAVASIPDQEDFCDGLTVQFTNNSINSDTYLWDFGVVDSDLDISTEFEPEFTFPDTGLYIITLIANPGTLCADTAITTYSAYPVIFPDIVYEGALCINGDMVHSFSSTANTDSDATFSWDFGPGSQPANSSLADPPDVVFGYGQSTFEVVLVVEDNGCEESDTLIINQPPPPQAGIIPQSAWCSGYVFTFEHDSENGQYYTWDFGIPGENDVSDEEQPTYTFPGDGEYEITLVVSSDGTCPDTATMNFSIYGDLDPYFAPQNPQCFTGNSFDFIAMGATTDAAQYEWNFGPVSIPQNSVDPTTFGVTYSETGSFEVSLTITENNCTETYTDTVFVVAEPILEFDISGASGCVPLTVEFENSSSSESPLFYYWQFGDGEVSNAQNPVHTYYSTGNFDVSLTIVTTSGCIIELTETEINAVSVYPPPQAGFLFDEQNLDILSAQVQVTSVAGENVECYYVTSDGATYDDCDFTHFFGESGQQWIQQFVTNEYGCTDMVIGYVNINGYTFYAPNSFTPNHDGINDVWIPVMTGVSEYELKIYDRWGECIFQTSDPEEAWTGNVHGGSHFAADGVYQWRVVMKDLLNYPHDFEGHLSLIR